MSASSIEVCFRVIAGDAGREEGAGGRESKRGAMALHYVVRIACYELITSRHVYDIAQAILLASMTRKSVKPFPLLRSYEIMHGS
eukprot:2970125-Pleurochrysis_carterae.AAC.1